MQTLQTENIMKLHEDLTQLEFDGVWEKLGTGFSSVGKWFSTFGCSL